MKNNNYKSKVTPILLDIANRNGYRYILSESDPDAGYLLIGNRRFYFTYGTLDLNTDAATGFARNKLLSSGVAKEVGVRLPIENHVNYVQGIPQDEYISLVKQFIDKVGLPLIIKPLQGTQGKNIFKIESIDEIDFAVKSIISDKEDFLIQEYIDVSTEIRVVLLDGDVIQCYTRDYVHIIGDGSTKIRKLIENKNEYFASRQRNTKINIQDSQIQSILGKKKYNLDTVLPHGERLDLSYGRNLSKGGECSFVENHMSGELVNFSREIARVTGLRLVGLDLFLSVDVSLVKEKKQVTFIEYNASPDMENNFYYDDGYTETLHKIYEKIFNSIAG